MVSYKNVSEDTLSDYIMNLPDGLKLVGNKNGPAIISFKHTSLPVTLTYYKTTRTVLIQGNTIAIIQHVNLFQKVFS